jgi:hypothetical protein
MDTWTYGLLIGLALLFAVLSARTPPIRNYPRLGDLVGLQLSRARRTAIPHPLWNTNGACKFDLERD